MITKEQTTHIAQLARLELSDAETDNFTSQLGAIIKYVDLLDAADVSGVEPTCYVEPEHDPMRDDVETPSMSAEALFANAPSVKKDHFAVPKIIGQTAGSA